MPYNSLDYNGMRSDQLRSFCQQVAQIKETPELINLVATNSEYHNICRIIAQANTQNRKMFSSFCQQNGFNPNEIQNRVGLVATVLGLNKQVDNRGQGNYYRILGVAPNADGNTIRKAYRKKAQLLHPDKHKSDKGNNDAFIELHAAYSQLRDPDLRKIYHVTPTPVDVQTRSAEDGTSAPPWPRPAVGHFISLVCVLIGGMVIITFTHDKHYQSRSSYNENYAKIKQSDADQTNANDASSKAKYNKIPKSSTTFISTKFKKEDAEKKAANIGDTSAENAASAKLIEPTVEKKRPSLNNAPMDNGIVKSDMPEKAAPPVFGAVLGDVTFAPENPKHHAIQPDTVASKSYEQGVNLIQVQRVISFLGDYTRTYEKKDLEKLRTFFAVYALEQGKPLEILLTKYQETFDSVQSLKYNIELKSITVEKETGDIFVEGAFTAQYQVTENSWNTNTGPIRLELRDASDGLLVSRIEYKTRR